MLASFKSNVFNDIGDIMSNTSLERYLLPIDVDSSFSAMQERLTQLQPALKSLMGRAIELFDGVYPQAPHPSVDASIAYAVGTMDMCPVEGIPMGRELTVVLGSGKWLRVFRNTDSSPDSYPRERLWVSQPVDNAQMRVNVLKTHHPNRAKIPYDIEVSDYSDKGQHLGFVGGADYYRKEPFIQEANEVINAATQLTMESGLLIPAES
ncbi:MAG: hypothetical protein JWS12_799 [Candidatus Saccharibacteria bacterium]|nr:hypothetical protein [Candidatus Saccharibacteria bacterium]